MPQIRTRITVCADHTITGTAPPDVPAGEHDVTITVAARPVRHRAKKRFSIEDLPEHDLGPWPEGLSLRREDLYDDDGR